MTEVKLQTEYDKGKDAEVMGNTLTFLDPRTISVSINVNRHSRHRTFFIDYKTMKPIHIVHGSPSNPDVLASQERYYYSEWFGGGLVNELYCVTHDSKPHRTIPGWMRKTVSTSQGLFSLDSAQGLNGILHGDKADEVQPLAFLQRKTGDNFDVCASPHSHKVIIIKWWLQQNPEFDYSRSHSLEEIAHFNTTVRTSFPQRVYVLDVKTWEASEIKVTALQSHDCISMSVTNSHLFTGVGVWSFKAKKWCETPGYKFLEACGSMALGAKVDDDSFSVFSLQAGKQTKIKKLRAWKTREVTRLRQYTVSACPVFVVETEKKQSWYITPQEEGIVSEEHVLWHPTDRQLLVVKKNSAGELVLSKGKL